MRTVLVQARWRLTRAHGQPRSPQFVLPAPAGQRGLGPSRAHALACGQQRAPSHWLCRRACLLHVWLVWRAIVAVQGMMRGEELSQAYASADIFVMPSETETLGFVVLEAMASGLAVVAVAAGGLKDILTHPQVRHAGSAHLAPSQSGQWSLGARSAARMCWHCLCALCCLGCHLSACVPLNSAPPVSESGNAQP